MKKCQKCGGELIFMDDSYEDDFSTGFYVCGKCHEDYSIEEVENEKKT